MVFGGFPKLGATDQWRFPNIRCPFRRVPLIRVPLIRVIVFRVNTKVTLRLLKIILGLYRDNGEEHGNCCLGFRV